MLFNATCLFISLWLRLLISISNTEQFNTDSKTELTENNQESEKHAKPISKMVENSGEDDEIGDHGNGNTRHGRNRNIIFTKRLGVTYAWDRWENWSRCGPYSCVQIKRRKCIERILNDTNSTPIDHAFFPDANGHFGCFGILKRYRHCMEKCKVNRNKLRDQHCASFNRDLYKGTFHNWIGHEDKQNECELFCRSRDSNTLISMNQSVIDGVPCEKPSIYYTHGYRGKAVCVEGVCRAVHSSGAIRPSTTSDSQRMCGSVLCQIVSELFSKTKLDFGYNYVTTIPAGAMNLTIKQISRSDNLLALKTDDDQFIINGQNHASLSGVFEYNDDIFDYNRELGWITSKGPLVKPVVLLLYSQGQNTGVKYDYVIPVPSASLSEEEELQTQWNELGQPLDEIDESDIDIADQIARAKERKRRKFSWKLLGFGECSRSCGPGVQSPKFRCIRDVPTRYYSPKRCAFAEKPVFSEDIYQCNRGLCPAYWRSSDYDECHCPEGSVEGVRTRIVRCVQEQITGKIELVDENLCEKEKLPELQETCRCPRQFRRRFYARGHDKAPKVYSRLIGATPAVRSIQNSTQPLRRHLRDDRVDKAGVWLMSPWIQDCLENCGHGYEHRSIYCDRTAPYTDLCDLHFTPEQRRPCKMPDAERNEAQVTCLSGAWFTSEWSNCTGDCFKLQRKRMVVCLRDGYAVGEEECEGLKKPAEHLNCSLREVNYCGPKWHYSEWSECSRSCGEGTQRRYAKCLEYDVKQNAMIESNNCKYIDREPVYGACNLQKCEGNEIKLNTVIADTSNALSVAVPPNCNDEFSNCKRINRQRLCRLPYYKNYCCLTCSGYH